MSSSAACAKLVYVGWALTNHPMLRLLLLLSEVARIQIWLSRSLTNMFVCNLIFLKVRRVMILNTPLTSPDLACTSTPEKNGAKVSKSVGILLERVIALPSKGTQCRRDVVVSTTNIFCRRDLNSRGTLTAGVCFGMPISTEMLISLVSSFPPGWVERGVVVLSGGGNSFFGSGGASRFSSPKLAFRL